MNVLGDSFGAAIVEHYSKKELAAPGEPAIELRPNGNSVLPITIDNNANDTKGRTNSSYVDERM